MIFRSPRLLLTLVIGLGGAGLRAGTTASPATVIAVSVTGTVEVQHGQSAETEAVTEGAQLGISDTITTAAKSSVMLVLPSGSMVTLKEKSRLKIAVALHSPLVGEALAANDSEPRETGTSQTGFELAFGQMLTRVRKLNPTSSFTVQTPVSVAAVRGTVFEVSYQADARGEAHYNLSTSSGLVHVTPHEGKMVAVPADERVDFAAEFGKKGIKIKNLKTSRLAQMKKRQIEKEARDNEHTAGELIKKVQAAKTKAAAERANTTTNARDNLTKPATPPKIPPKPKAIKRPPRRPGG